MGRDPEHEHDRGGVVGRFRIEAEVVRTATGTLYRARDGESGPPVSVKLCLTAGDGGHRPRRDALEREFHTLRALDHVVIPKAIAFEAEATRAYFAMEDVSESLPEGKLSVERVCAIIADVAAALALVHGRGFVHGAVTRELIGLTEQGRAKSRDFGWMCGFGARGTPPRSPAFAAPEVVQLQSLDGRADLFALGALAYALLTGRDAYPASDVMALRDVWRSPVAPPSYFAPAVPARLDRLVLQLLALNRSARPSCVLDVLEELQVFDAPRYEGLEDARRFLQVPKLIARDALVTDIRRCVLALLTGAGGSLIIQGPAGFGRSRILDACVLEGKLLGATVVRLDAGDGERTEWAAARSICLQLLPEISTAFQGFPRHVLGRVIGSLQAEGEGSSLFAGLERELVLRELRDFLLTLTRGQRLVIAVDDIDRIDEPSAALIAMLAQRAEDHGLLIASTARTPGRGDETPSAAMRLLRGLSAAIELAAFQPAETQLLIGSLFSATDSLAPLAKHVQRAAAGQPRATVDVIHSLIDRRVVRYEGGQFVLHRDIGKASENADSALRFRVEHLSSDARELALSRAVTPHEELSLSEYAALTQHGSSERVARALIELVAQRVFQLDRHGYRFLHEAQARVAAELVQDEERRRVHRELAHKQVRQGRASFRTVQHLLEAEEIRAALELIGQVAVKEDATAPAVLERLLAEAAVRGVSKPEIHRLQRALLSAASATLAVDSLRRVLPQLARDLESRSGVSVYRDLGEHGQKERRTEARAAAEQQFAATAEADRVNSPDDALRELVLLWAEVSRLTVQTYDVGWIDLLGDARRIAGFASELDAAIEVCFGAREAVAGRVLQALHCFEQAQRALEARGDTEALEALRAVLRLQVREHLGLLQASIGSREAEQHAQILEAHRAFRGVAYRIRARMNLSRGNVNEARKWQARYEVLQLQQSSRSADPAGDLGFELLARAYSGDVAGMEPSLAAIAELAKRCPGWQPAWCLGEAHRRWLTGDLASAIEVLGPALDSSLAGVHAHFGHAIAVHVVLLCEQDRVREACERARAYERICHRLQVGLADRWLRQGLAYALGRSDKHAAASALLDQLIEQLEGLGVGGLPLGSAYEIRAKIALYSGDRPGFERAAQRSADAYFETGNPAMMGKVSQLAEEAAELEAGAPA